MNNLLIPSSTTNRVGASALFRLAPILNASSDLIFNGASALRKQSPSRSGKSVRDFCTRSDPDVRRLAETARITITEEEPDFDVSCWNLSAGFQLNSVSNNRFGQLQAVDLESVAPAIRADTEGDNLRDDVPEIFENKEAILAAIPSYEEPYIKVPKVLNKE
ncbi:unnamed protein product [Rhodiola kirilowii]